MHGDFFTVTVNSQVLHLQADSTEFPLGFVGSKVHGSADHHLGQLLRAGFSRSGGLDNSTVSEDGDPVAKAHHLAEFVRDEDQAVPAVRHPTKDYEEIIDLPGGQNRSWFVKDQ